MAFSEFYCQEGGHNCNSGDTNRNQPDFIYEGGTFVQSTGVFTVAAGNPLLDGVQVGRLAAIYSSGDANAAAIAVVTGVSESTITLSTTLLLGILPANGVRSVRIGGAWGGPEGANIFPFGSTIASAGSWNNLRKYYNFIPRINLKNDKVYRVTTQIVAVATARGRFVIQGYQESPGDGNKAIIDGGTTGSSYVLFNSNTAQIVLDLIFRNNGSTGNANGVTCSGLVKNCCYTGMRGAGLHMHASTAYVVDCEAYNNNQSNTSSSGGFLNEVGNTRHINCISHHNLVHGFGISNGLLSSIFINCISCFNSGSGFVVSGNNAGAPSYIIGCDSYMNNIGLNFLSVSGGGRGFFVMVRNCNFIKNTVAAIVAPTTHGLLVQNCSFGDNLVDFSGNLNRLIIDGNIYYDTVEIPWENPHSGNFRIVHTLSKYNGYNIFINNSNNNIFFIDVGACPNLSKDELLTKHSTVSLIR